MYTPAFCVDGKYFEVKGYMTEKACQKLSMFYEKYPDILLEIVDGDKYNKLREKYKDVIAWEGK